MKLTFLPDIYKKLAFALFLVGAAVAGGYFASFLPSADWLPVYDFTIRKFLAGGSPYAMIDPACSHCLFVNPPWTLLFLLPFALFTPAFSRGLIFVLSLASIFYWGWRMRANPISVGAMILSPTIIGTLLAGNLDTFIIWGALLPPVWGLPVLMIKPQVGLGMAFYEGVQSLRRRQWKSLLQNFAPLFLLVIFSLLFFPDWLKTLREMPGNPWNRSLFPYGIPLGLFLFFIAFRTRNALFALPATLFFSPYLTLYSYCIIQFVFLHEDVEKYLRRDILQILLTIFFWAVTLIFRL